MLTRADAIKHLEPYLDNECYTEKHKQAVKLAIDALREQEDRVPAKPLTLEELRLMNGAPVWVHNLKDGMTFWALAYEDCVWHRWRWGCLKYAECGKTWIAYRHKQEEYDRLYGEGNNHG